VLLNQPDDPQQLCVLASWTFSATLEAADCVQKCSSCGPGVLQVPGMQDITGPTQVLALWTRIEEQMTYSNLSEWFEYTSGVARKRTLDAKLRKIRIGQTLTDALTDASTLP